MTEPILKFCTLRSSGAVDDPDFCIDVECRFNDGQKFAAIQVDGDFGRLAWLIHNYLNSKDFRLDQERMQEQEG